MLEELDKREAEDQAEDAALFGPQNREPLAASDKYKAIRQILNQEPILVQPCLQWLQLKLAELANAKLATLYTQEQLEEMRKQIA